MTRSPRAAAVVLTAALALSSALAALPSPSTAHAAEGDVTWSVQPANESGADGRSWMELTLDPGQQVTEHLALRNLSATTVTFAIKAADGYLTDTGRFNMLPSDQPSVAAGTWVAGPATVEVAAGATQVVPFTVSVPENATPGDHAAGIAATVQSVGTDQGGTGVAIESRVGFPIMTRVTGELRPSLDVQPVDVSYNLSWNPFQPGEIVATYDLVNDGNVRMQAAPVVTAQGREAGVDAQAMELLPGQSRTVTMPLSGVWPLFFAPVQVSVEPTLITPDGEPEAVDAIVQEVGVWTIPVPQLLVLAGIVLLVLALVAGRRRSKRRVEALVAQAREAGRQEGAQ